MKKKIIVLIVLLLMITTGCTKNFLDKETNKRYTSNILCQPETEEIVDVYEKNNKEIKIDLKDLPKCEKFKVTSGGYEGLWTSIFVKPLAYIIIKLGMLIKSYGISIMILGVIIRAIMIPLTKKSTSMSKNMNKAKPELDRLEKKYANKTDAASSQMKAQELMMIYKKYEISPISGCLFSFLQIPIFFAFLEAIQRIPVIYEEKLLVFQLGTTPTEALKSGNYWYLILVALIILATYYSFKNMNTASMDQSQQKQTKTMLGFMVIFISIASFSLPAAIALYWIVSNLFTIIQNYIMNKDDEPKKVKVKKAKRSKEVEQWKS